MGQVRMVTLTAYLELNTEKRYWDIIPEKFEDMLFEVPTDYMQIVPNGAILTGNLYEETGKQTGYDLEENELIDLSKVEIEKCKSNFQEKYKILIDYLIEQLGVENVSVKFGLISYQY